MEFLVECLFIPFYGAELVTVHASKDTDEVGAQTGVHIPG